MKHFRAYQLANGFYQSIALKKWPPHLRDQVLRSSSSIALNLAEGAGLSTPRQKVKHYNIALGSLRECQAAIDLAQIEDDDLREMADNLGAHLFRLCKATK